MNLAQLARALGGEVVNRGQQQILCPGPGHSQRDRSLSIRIDPSAPDGFMVNSFAGDPFPTCRDHVKACLGLATRRSRPSIENPAVVRAAPRPNEIETRNKRWALAIWR